MPEQISVLLADDHAVVRTGIRKTIEEIPGMMVATEAANGPQLFDVLSKASYDILLIDVTMPDFEPISAIQRIRKDYPQMKILVVSAYDDDIYVQGMLSAGVNGYHLKDQPLNDLKRAIERVLAGEIWLSPPIINKLIGDPHGFTHTPFLTRRQRDLLHQLKDGKDNQTIAAEMGLSVKTVENHLTRLYRVLNVQSRLEAMNYILRHTQLLGIPGQQATQKPAGPVKESERISVMVVDDNGRFRELLQNIIGKACPNAWIYEADNIHSALHMIQETMPDLVFIDVVLGEENGISCTRQIKALYPTIRVILISAYPDREFHRLGLEAGAIAFLDKKDLDLPALRQVIEDVI